MILIKRIDPVFPHTVTLFNHIGDRQGQPIYSACLIERVRVCKNHTEQNGAECMHGKVHFLSGFVRTDKPFCEYEVWQTLGDSEKTRFYTLRGGNCDLICEGNHTYAVRNAQKLPYISRVRSVKRTAGAENEIFALETE
jgi:hypothetical protein